MIGFARMKGRPANFSGSNHSFGARPALEVALIVKRDANAARKTRARLAGVGSRTFHSIPNHSYKKINCFAFVLL